MQGDLAIHIGIPKDYSLIARIMYESDLFYALAQVILKITQKDRQKPNSR